MQRTQKDGHRELQGTGRETGKEACEVCEVQGPETDMETGTDTGTWIHTETGTKAGRETSTETGTERNNIRYSGRHSTETGIEEETIRYSDRYRRRTRTTWRLQALGGQKRGAQAALSAAHRRVSADACTCARKYAHIHEIGGQWEEVEEGGGK